MEKECIDTVTSPNPSQVVVDSGFVDLPPPAKVAGIETGENEDHSHDLPAMECTNPTWIPFGPKRDNITNASRARCLKIGDWIVCEGAKHSSKGMYQVGLRLQHDKDVCFLCAIAVGPSGPAKGVVVADVSASVVDTFRVVILASWSVCAPTDIHDIPESIRNTAIEVLSKEINSQTPSATTPTTNPLSKPNLALRQ